MNPMLKAMLSAARNMMAGWKLSEEPVLSNEHLQQVVADAMGDGLELRHVRAVAPDGSMYGALLLVRPGVPKLLSD